MQEIWLPHGQTYDEEKEEEDDELHEDEEINADGGDLIGSFFGLLSTFKSRWLYTLHLRRRSRSVFQYQEIR